MVKSRFDPINEDVCGAFSDEKLCHMYIAGYLIAESWKSTGHPSLRFKLVGTTNPTSIVTMLSIANHLTVKHGIMTKAGEKKNENVIELYTKYGNTLTLLQILPPLIEPTKEIKKQVLLRRDMLGYTAGKLFDTVGDGGRKGEKTSADYNHTKQSGSS